VRDAGGDHGYRGSVSDAVAGGEIVGARELRRAAGQRQRGHKTAHGDDLVGGVRGVVGVARLGIAGRHGERWVLEPGWVSSMPVSITAIFIPAPALAAPPSADQAALAFTRSSALFSLR